MKPITENIPRSKYAELIEKSYRLKNNIDFGASFYFVYDVVKKYYVYLEDKFYNITGYPPSLIIRNKIDFISKYMHLDDLAQYHMINLKWRDLIEYSFKKDREKLKISFDFRLINSEGNSLKLLYQTLHIEFNRGGQMLYIIGKCSNISHWNKNNDMILSIAYPSEFKNFHYSHLPKNDTDADAFSSLERKIIRLLAEGSNSKDIAGEMGITFNTANTHRRNMLRKAKVRNTSELVSFAHSHHLV